jgi:aspartate/methionine/tyrosine aminotransferase
MLGVMDYRAFRSFRDELLRDHNPRRFDQLDPAGTLTEMRPTLPKVTPEADLETVLASWSSLFAFPRNEACVLAGNGVRAGLLAVYGGLKRSGTELWLPGDVYPVYWKSAADHGLSCHAYTTVPEPDMRRLEQASDNACLLITNPLAPVGRHLSESECRFLLRWLEHSPQRRLLVDTVYEFNTRFHASTEKLWQSEQTCLLHSIAKSWLSPDTLGLVVTHKNCPWTVQDSDLPCPSPSRLGIANALFRREAELPGRIQELFTSRWRTLTADIQAVAPQWEPPESGYLTVVPRSADDLLAQCNWLTVPASAFGSSLAGCSVLSCM